LGPLKTRQELGPGIGTELSELYICPRMLLLLTPRWTALDGMHSLWSVSRRGGSMEEDAMAFLSTTAAELGYNSYCFST
jgi:hypothetical protein